MAVLSVSLVVVFALLIGCVALTAVVARKAEAAVPRPGRFVEVDGVRLHYVEEGAGAPILMIHGLGSQLQTFSYALARLLRDRFRVIMIDRPGCGYSGSAPAATLAAQAGLLDRFLVALGIERALVVGHSLGGAIALALALDHPDRVAGLVLLAPATQPQDAPPALLRHLAIRSDLARWLAGWLVVTPLGLLAGKRHVAAVFAPEPVPADFGVRAGGMLQIRPAAFRNASRDLAEAGPELAVYAARQDRLAIPIGVIFGTSDHMLDLALHGDGLAAKAHGVVLEHVTGAGHMLPITAPEQCAGLIAQVATRAFEMPLQHP